MGMIHIDGLTVRILLDEDTIEKAFHLMSLGIKKTSLANECSLMVDSKNLS